MFVMILPLPRGRELTIGSRIPCLPDESIDDLSREKTPIDTPK
jgi:hypothetical protein